MQRAALDGAISEARRLEADALVSVFHGCHRFLVKRAIESRAPFEVVNWVSLLGRSLGVEQKDRYRAFALLGDEARSWRRRSLDGGQGIPLEDLRRGRDLGVRRRPRRRQALVGAPAGQREVGADEWPAGEAQLHCPEHAHSRSRSNPLGALHDLAAWHNQESGAVD